MAISAFFQADFEIFYPVYPYQEHFFRPSDLPLALLVCWLVVVLVLTYTFGASFCYPVNIIVAFKHAHMRRIISLSGKCAGPHRGTGAACCDRLSPYPSTSTISPFSTQKLKTL